MKNTFKKLIAVFISALLVLSLTTAFANGDDKITVTFDGAPMTFDVEPMLINDRTLVPFRAIFEALGCAVSYAENADGDAVVYAQRGDDFVTLFINNTTMYVNDDELTLDVAPQIVNDRTLVPLRAVSESLDCTVNWANDTNTAEISPKAGQYKITYGRNEKTVTLNGNVLMTVSCVYPIIENADKNEFINQINKKYNDEANAYVADIEKEYAPDAELMFNENENYTPMEFCLTYKINTNRQNILSVSSFDYRNANGAHPNTESESITYDTAAEKELTLYDVLNDTEDEINNAVYEGFSTLLADNGIEMTEEQTNTVKDAAPYVNWYATDDSIVLYFNPYDIAPYAFGIPTIEIPYDEEVMNIDLSQANLDSLEFELDGNPTTGYTWEIINSDSDMTDIKSEYIPSQTDADIAGAGGKYKFTVKGLSQGNTEIKLAYMRTFEKDTAPIDSVSYKLYISKDSKITVLDYTK